MTEEIFQAAMVIADRSAFAGIEIVLGGGEPTLHPRLFDFIDSVLATGRRGYNLRVITNGSLREPTFDLLKMALAGKLQVAVSLDGFHRPIDPEVVRVFKRYDKTGRGIGVTGTRPGGEICNHGRARSLPAEIADKYRLGDRCCCDSLLVDPQGRLWSCGCMVEQFGTVFAPEIPDEYLDAKRRQFEIDKSNTENLQRAAFCSSTPIKSSLRALFFAQRRCSVCGRERIAAAARRRHDEA